MGKKQKRKQQDIKQRGLSRNGYMIIGGIAIIVALGVYFGVRTLVPVNGTSPVFALPLIPLLKRPTLHKADTPLPASLVEAGDKILESDIIAQLLL